MKTVFDYVCNAHAGATRQATKKLSTPSPILA